MRQLSHVAPRSTRTKKISAHLPTLQCDVRSIDRLTRRDEPTKRRSRSTRAVTTIASSASTLLIYLLTQSTGVHLRIREHLPQVVDCPHGTPMASSKTIHACVLRVHVTRAIACTRTSRCSTRAGLVATRISCAKCGRPGHLGQPGDLPVVADGQDHVPVGGRKVLGRDDVGVGVAHPGTAPGSWRPAGPILPSRGRCRCRWSRCGTLGHARRQAVLATGGCRLAHEALVVCQLRNQQQRVGPVESGSCGHVSAP